MTTPGTAEQDLLSIGKLAESSGVSVDTLRVWERRYGRPNSIRLPSGHRRYPASEVRWLRQVTEALSRGKRPSAVVPLPDEDLARLLDELAAGETDPVDPLLEERMEMVGALRAGELLQSFRGEAARTGLRTVIVDSLAPLIVRVGRDWADAVIAVRHEHLFTEVVHDFLRSARQDLAAAPGAPPVVFACLADESHDLGVQMAATIAALSGVRPVTLGPRSPLEEIVAAARATGAAAVAISVSLATGGVETDRRLAGLRGALPRGLPLLIGGMGARGVRRGPKGVQYLTGLPALEAWIEKTLLPAWAKSRSTKP